MKKYLGFAMFVVLAVALVSPVSVSAKTKAGAKPGSFFYFFDKAFEKTSLFFIFNPEKKAKKALENAEERLAEVEELEKEKEEKEVFEIRKEETKKTETSEKEVEKTDNKLGQEENEETEIKDDKKDEVIKNDRQSKEIEKLKKEIEALKQKVGKPVVIEKTQSSSSQAKQKEVTINKQENQQQYELEMARCKAELNEEFNLGLTELKRNLNGEADSSYDSILHDLNRASGSGPDSCRRATSLSGFDSSDAHPLPTYKQFSPVPNTYTPNNSQGDILNYFEKQKQESLLKELEMNQFLFKQKQERIENNRSLNCTMENGYYSDGVCYHF